MSVLHLSMLACAGAVTLSPGCCTSWPDRGTPVPGTYFQTTPLRYRLSARTYRLHVPQNYDEQKAWPLVLVLHGGFGTARSIERRSGFSELADREGIIVAYPNGIGLLGFLQHWNAGHCCGLAEKDHVDDVGFLRYVIGDVSSKVRVDPQRVYVVGHSNGGMLAYRFASENPACVAGIGVVAGSIGSSKEEGQAACRTGPPKTAVPLIAIHGRDDKTVPFAGGLSLQGARRYYISVPDSAELWARYCGCDLAPEARDDPHGGWSTLTWRDRQGETWAVLYALDAWEHIWPGTSNHGRLPPDDPLRTFDASQVIWAFFRDRTPAAGR